MNNQDLNLLSKNIYQTNKEKGFHDEDHSVEHLLCLIVSELMEIIEADRKGRRANLDYFNKCIAAASAEYDSQYQKLFEVFNKDTVEDEFAETVIRLLDLAGTKQIEIENNLSVTLSLSESNTLTENVWLIIRSLVNREVKGFVSLQLQGIFTLCNSLSISLSRHVVLKLKYNSMRPYRHGKQY